MINQELVNFVEEKLKQGVNKEEITKELLAKNWSSKDVEEAFNTVANGGVSNTGIKIILSIQIFIVLFNIISLSSISSNCRGVGEFCGLPGVFILIPSVILFIIISIIGHNSANKKIKIYESKNQKVPIYVRLLSLSPKSSNIILIALILFVIIFLLYIKYYTGIPIVLF